MGCRGLEKSFYNIGLSPILMAPDHLSTNWSTINRDIMISNIAEILKRKGVKPDD